VDGAAELSEDASTLVTIMCFTVKLAVLCRGSTSHSAAVADAASRAPITTIAEMSFIPSRLRSVLH
jgi:hypothetical protein